MTLHISIAPAKGARESFTASFAIETDGSIPDDKLTADLLARIARACGPHQIRRQTLLPGRPGKHAGLWGRVTRGRLTLFKSSAIPA